MLALCPETRVSVGHHLAQYKYKHEKSYQDDVALLSMHLSGHHQADFHATSFTVIILKILRCAIAVSRHQQFYALSNLSCLSRTFIKIFSFSNTTKLCFKHHKDVLPCSLLVTRRSVCPIRRSARLAVLVASPFRLTVRY